MYWKYLRRWNRTRPRPSIFIANQIKQLGAKPAIVRSHHSNHEDEYHLIRNSFKDLILNRNRVDAIKSAEKLNYDILILDDGLQDYRIKRSKYRLF